MRKVTFYCDRCKKEIKDAGIELQGGSLDTETEKWISMTAIRLHFHPSRKMSARDTFRKKDGTTVTIEFDYTKTHPVTKEAAYRIPESGEEAHSEREA